MGAPLLSDSATPSCRRWERAWLERPLRVSKQAPHTSHVVRFWAGRRKGKKERKKKIRVRRMEE